MPTDIQTTLVEAARAVRLRARAPYSRFLVGSAVRGESGAIYAGCNVESAAYPLTCCAERAAIYAAVAGGETRITHCAVVTETASSPCGGCRQVIFEMGSDCTVIVAGLTGEARTVGIRALLPEGFDGSELPR